MKIDEKLLAAAKSAEIQIWIAEQGLDAARKGLDAATISLEELRFVLNRNNWPRYVTWGYYADSNIAEFKDAKTKGVNMVSGETISCLFSEVAKENSEIVSLEHAKRVVERLKAKKEAA